MIVTSAYGWRASSARSASRVAATVRWIGRIVVRLPWRSLRLDPRQQVRVVLDVQHEDAAAVGDHARQQVERVRRVARDDRDVVGTRVDEPRDRLTGRLVQGRRHLRQVARAAVHRRVQRQHLRHAGGDGLQGRGAGGVVQVGVDALRAVDQGDGGGAADDREQGAHLVDGSTREALGDDGHDGPPTRSGGTPAVVEPRACRAPDGTQPGRHPGHPTAEEGCRPASRGLTLALMTCDEGPGSPGDLSTRHANRLAWRDEMSTTWSVGAAARSITATIQSG